MAFESKSIDISRVKNEKQIDELLSPWLKKGFDVRAMTKDVIVLTRQTAK